MKRAIIEIKCDLEQNLFDLVIIPVGNSKHRKIEKRHLPMPDFGFLTMLQSFRNNWANLEGSGALSRVTLVEAHNHKCEFGKRINEAFFSSVQPEWGKVIAGNPGNYIFDVDPFFWKVPFELICQIDSHGNGNYLDSASTPIVRKVKGSNTSSEMVFLDKPTIYFIDANPIGSPTEAEEQIKSLKSQMPSQLAGKVLIKCSPPVSVNDTQWDRISSDLLRFSPSILHIVGHGKGADGLELEGETRYSDSVNLSYEALVEHLILIKSVKLLVIVACGSNSLFTEKPNLVRELFNRTKINAIVVMATDIGIKATIKFTKLFYMALWYGMDVTTAIAYTRSMFRSLDKKPISLQWSVPMYYQTSPVNPFSNWLTEIEKSPVAQQLPFSSIENALDHAKAMNQTITDLSELGRQITPSKCKLAFYKSNLIQGRKNFENDLSHFNQIYFPQDEMLVNIVRKTSAKALPLIDRCINSLEKHLAIIDDNTVRGSETLVECLEEAFHLIMVRESAKFKSWIST